MDKEFNLPTEQTDNQFVDKCSIGATLVLYTNVKVGINDMAQNKRRTDAEWLELFEEKEQEARQNPHKVIRVHAGSYYVFLRGELVEIRTFDDESNPEWIASEKHQRWYGDPLPTKRDVVQSLELWRYKEEEKAN